MRDVEDMKGHTSSVVKSPCLFRWCVDVVVVVGGATLKNNWSVGSTNGKVLHSALGGKLRRTFLASGHTQHTS